MIDQHKVAHFGEVVSKNLVGSPPGLPTVTSTHQVSINMCVYIYIQCKAHCLTLYVRQCAISFSATHIVLDLILPKHLHPHAYCLSYKTSGKLKMNGLCSFPLIIFFHKGKFVEHVTNSFENLLTDTPA